MSFGRAKWFFTNYDIITLLTNSNTYTHTNTSEQITYQILVKDLKTSAIRSSCRSVYHFQFPPVFSMLLIYSALSEKRWPENRMLLNKCMIMYRTLLPSPVLSTTGFCFGFGSSPSFFRELFLHWSPVAYWAPNNLGSSPFSVLSFCLFILFMGFSRQEYWSGLPFRSPVDHTGKG